MRRRAPIALALLALATACGEARPVRSRSAPGRLASPSIPVPAATAGRASPTGCGGARCDLFRRLMRPDQAPPLSSPRAVPGRQARGLRPEHLVVGLALRGEARAYPLNVLAIHRVANDLLGGERVAVAHSPLTGSVLCARTEGPLHASGAVYEGDDLLADEQTGDLWSVMLGRSLFGPRQGATLERLPCVVMRWDAWRSLRPGTRVAWPARAPAGVDYGADPWAWYREDDSHLVLPVHFVDLRHPNKLEVLGVARGGEARELALPQGRERRVVQTIVGGEPLLVILDGAARLAVAYSRRLEGGQVLTFAPLDRGGALELRDHESATRWSVLGEAIAGPRRGARLARVDTSRAYHFAWVAFHPGTTSLDPSADENDGLSSISLTHRLTRTEDEP